MTAQFNIDKDTRLTRSQRHAINYAVRQLTRVYNTDPTSGTYKSWVAEVEHDDFEGFGGKPLTITYLRLTSDYPNAKGSLLSALNDDRWSIIVSPRGKLTAITYPPSCKQFAGKKHLGIHIEK